MLTENASKIQQKYLGAKGLIVLIAVMNMFVPLSIDLYLPALPTIGTEFAATPLMVNLTLVSFFFFFAVGILLFGPVSDKYGRRKILLLGIVLYTLASGLCAFAGSIYSLIAYRIVQALGAGGMVAVSMAVVKDAFYGTTKNRVLALVQAMAVIAPMVAPVIGAFLLQFVSWRGTFGVLIAAGAVNLAASFFFEETLSESERYKGSFWSTFGRLAVVGKNVGFTGVLTVFSLLAAPYMAYVAVSSYVYVQYFGLSEQVYSYFFAANSFFCRCRSVFIYEVDRDRIAASIYLWLFYFYCSSSGSAADSREYFTVVVFNSLFTGHDHGKRCQAFQYGHIIGSAEDGYRLCLVADQCGEYCFWQLGYDAGCIELEQFY